MTERGRGKQSKRAQERSAFHAQEPFQFCVPGSDINRPSFYSKCVPHFECLQMIQVSLQKRGSSCVQHLGGPVLTPTPQPAQHIISQNKRRPCSQSWASHTLIKGHRETVLCSPGGLLRSLPIQELSGNTTPHPGSRPGASQRCPEAQEHGPSPDQQSSFRAPAFP